jgi:hypothetical protein
MGWASLAESSGARCGKAGYWLGERRQRQASVRPVADASEILRRGSRTLVILAGPAAPVALKLKEVANDGDTLVYLARLRAQEGRTTQEIQAALDGLLIQYGHDHARFVEAANTAVRWGDEAGASEKES